MNGQEERHNVLLGIVDPHIASLYSDALVARGHFVFLVKSAKHAADVLAREHFDIVLVETALGDRHAGLDLAREILSDGLHPEVVVLADYPNVAHAVAIAKAGAFDYLSAPVSVDHVVAIVAEAGKLSRSRRTARRESQVDEVAGAFLMSSVPAVQEMEALARMVAAHTDSNALILGESGSGKDIVARLIHSLSAQSRAPFVVVNLVDIAPEQLEERLFGTAEPDGSFQEGASQRHGSFAIARGGTLVLRELSELSAELQPRILRVIEQGKFRPINGRVDVPFHARVLATTDRDISGLVDEQSFHPALFYRLASVLIRMPPLRERAADIPRLSRAILEQVAADASRPDMQLSQGAVEVLSGYNWPGNIRELRNVLTRLALLNDQDLIDAANVSAIVGAPGMRDAIAAVPRARPSSRRPKASSMPAPRISGVIAAALDQPSLAERERIEDALAHYEGHRERAAIALGMSRTTLWTRMRLLGIDMEQFRKRRARA
jgi:DNA-binding NtrC family response regulator